MAFPRDTSVPRQKPQCQNIGIRRAPYHRRRRCQNAYNLPEELGHFTAPETKQGNAKEYLEGCQKPVFSSNAFFFCEASPASQPQYCCQCHSCERSLYDHVPMAGISTPLLSLKLGTDIDDGVDQTKNSQNVNIGGRQTLPWPLSIIYIYIAQYIMMTSTLSLSAILIE